jgi:phosphatidate cytidylyltransferase
MSAHSPAPAKKSKKAVFVARLGSTLVLWAIVTIAIILNLNWLLALLIGGLSVLALIECLQMFDASRDRRYQVWTLLLGVAYLGFAFHHAQTHAAPDRTEFTHLDVFFLTVLAFGLFTVTLTRPLEGPTTLKRLLGAFFSFFYVIVLFSFMARVLYLPEENGVFYALYLLAVTKFTDMGAYSLGSLIGKRKMIPHISPGKTWEGLGGAFLGAYAASALIYFPFAERLSHFTLTDVFILPALLGAITVIGDLAESVIKRCLDVKDSGNMLPGIGGSLDLIDSLCFTAPALYLYMHYLTPLSAS